MSSCVFYNHTSMFTITRIMAQSRCFCYVGPHHIVKPHSMSSQCYACTDPGSIAPLRAFFWQAESSKIDMHIKCFVKFAVWHDNLLTILHAWAHCSRRPHRTPSSRYLKRVEGSVRRITALERVFMWQQEAREIWKQQETREMWKRTILPPIWNEWARLMWLKKHTMAQETHDPSSVPPTLIDSDSENDDRVPPAMSESSSDSDTPISIMLFQRQRAMAFSSRREL